MPRKIISFLICAIICFALFAPLNTSARYAPTEFEITAESVLLVNLDTGTVMFEQNADERRYMASLTKIMTAVVGLEQIEDLDNTYIIVSEPAISSLHGTGSSLFGLRVGERVPARMMIYANLVQSGNEASNALAEHISGDVPSFVELMNTRARELGMNDTDFENPHGLHGENHFTSARDLYILMRHAMTIPLFNRISQTRQFIMPETNLNSQRSILHTNLMLHNVSEFFYPYARGVKTGYTTPAGRCLVVIGARDGYNYLAIILGAPNEGRGDLTLARNLLRWAFLDFEYRRIVTSQEPIGEIDVRMSWSHNVVQLFAARDLAAIIPRAADISTITYEIELFNDTVNAPIARGDILGVAHLYLAQQRIATVDVVANENVSRGFLLMLWEAITTLTDSILFRILAAISLLLLIMMMTSRSMVAKRKAERRRQHAPVRGRNYRR